MYTYQQLADYIRENAITRGKTKGNAPINRVVQSAKEFIRYEAGEGSNILGYQYGYTDKHKVFTMTPAGVLTVHGIPYRCPSLDQYMFHALGMRYGSWRFKGVNNDVVRASDRKPVYKLGKDMVFLPDGTCANPVEFNGKRVDKAATALLRKKLPQFRQLFSLWLQPDTSAARPFRIAGGPVEALADEERWADLMEWVKAHGAHIFTERKWVSGKGYVAHATERLHQPDAYITSVLMPHLTAYEFYPTGHYFIPNA